LGKAENGPDLPERKLYLRFADEGSAAMENVLAVLRRNPGPYPVYFYFEADKRLIEGKREFWVSYQTELVQSLGRIIGLENVVWKVGSEAGK